LKAIDLTKSAPSLNEVLQLAGEENVVLRTAEGRQFVLAEIDDFADEVARVGQNNDLMKLLDERSRETRTVPLGQVRDHLKGPAKVRSATKPARKTSRPNTP
jgi:hypothetical protein